MKNLALTLSVRWGVSEQAVLKWLQARKITKIIDLIRFGFPHDAAMDKALADFWEFST
jgi:hypothetical protein